MCRVKTLSNRLGDRCATKALGFLSLIAACQLERWVMDLAASECLVALGYVSTVGAMDGFSSLSDKTRSVKPIRSARFGILPPSQVRFIPTALRTLSKAVVKHWFELPLEQRKELVKISQSVLLEMDEVSPKPITPTPRFSLQRFGLRISIALASLLSQKNVLEDILQSLYDFSHDVLNQSVQDETFTVMGHDFEFPGQARLEKGKKRRPVMS